jgi:hypothetical protein
VPEDTKIAELGSGSCTIVEVADAPFAGTLILPWTGVEAGVCPAGKETMPLAAEMSLSAQSRIFSILPSSIKASFK